MLHTLSAPVSHHGEFYDFISHSISSTSWRSHWPIHHPSLLTVTAAAVTHFILLPAARDWSAVLIASPHPHPKLLLRYKHHHACSIITTQLTSSAVSTAVFNMRRTKLTHLTTDQRWRIVSDVTARISSVLLSAIILLVSDARRCILSAYLGPVYVLVQRFQLPYHLLHQKLSYRWSIGHLTIDLVGPFS